jgi:DNA polymerase I-like protein with 3'-5' exonuclease and polymerase domains
MRYVAIDIEAKNLKPFGGTIWMLSVTENNKTQVFHDCYGFKKLPADIKKLFTDKKVTKIIHSSQYDAPYIELVIGSKISPIWDTELCETVIQGLRIAVKAKNVEPGSATDQLLRAHSTALQYVLPRYGFPEPDKSIRENFIDREVGIPFTKKEIEYVKGDTKYLPKIQKAQEYLLRRDHLWDVACLENDVCEVYHDMKARGIGFSKQIWKEIADINIKEFAKRSAKLPKEVTNWNSPAQVKEYFYKKGVMIDSYSEIDEVYLNTRNKTLGDFIFARELHKSVTSYGYNWFDEDYIDADGRIRCDVTQIINTGRNSMSNPNLQQLPGEGKDDYLHNLVMEILYGDNIKQKPQHRRAFVPKPGHVFVIGDFSGQEIGIMAANSGEKLWIDAMLRGEDIHALTASLINPAEWAAAKDKGCTFPKKCKCKGHLALRKPAKVNNFMLAYGGGAGKFSKKTGIDSLAARAYVAAHKRVIPKLTKWLNDNGQAALTTGVSYSADPYRRRRVLTGDEDWKIINQGKNSPVQSAGANMLKLAMTSFPWKEFPIVLVIHDEIILEVPVKDAVKAGRILKQVMEDSADYITGIKGLINVEPKMQMNVMKDLPTTKNKNLIKDGKFCYEI